jgi:hypothetical protein
MASQHRSLLELPEETLGQIAKHSSTQRVHYSKPKGHPLLGVSTGLRDAVFCSLSRLELDLKTQQPDDSNLQPLARLLGRACCKAAPGLAVELEMEEHCHVALPVLLTPVLHVQGWHNVHRLEVRVDHLELFTLEDVKQLWYSCCCLQLTMAQQRGADRSCPPLHLLGTALPSLRQLSISFSGSDLGSGELLVGLQQCQQLSTLSLLGFWISPTAVTAAAAALAQLPALRDLSLSSDCDINPAALMDQLTCLTALWLGLDGSGQVDSMFEAAARNPGLQTFILQDDIGDLEVTDDDECEALRTFLTSCPTLTYLSLDHMSLSEDVVDTILTHGTSITHLTAGGLVTSTNYSGQPSNLQSLRLYDSSSLQLANLPLRGVTHLQLWDEAMGDLCEDIGQLHLPTSAMAPDELPAVLQRATANLAACPAWQAKPEPCISLQGDGSDVEEYLYLAPEIRLQLLEALAPLGGPHVTEFQGCMAENWFNWGRPEVEALGHSLHSTQLSSLELWHCALHIDFWAALGEVFPSLEVLTLGAGVTCSASDLAVFCSRRQAGHPFKLVLAPRLFESHDGAGLQESLEAQGVLHVSVVKM